MKSTSEVIQVITEINLIKNNWNVDGANYYLFFF